jgi:YVTN family beta-propeller protein
MPMSFRRVGWLAAAAVSALICVSCGQVYRPVVIPVSVTPPDSSNFHAVFAISSNVAPNPGSVLQVDVSGDSDIGNANMGINPTHAAILPNNSRVFVASAGSLIPGDPDVIFAFTPAAESSTATGIGTPSIFSLPNVGPDQSSSIASISEVLVSQTSPPPPISYLYLVTVTLSSPIGTATVGGQFVISGVNIPGYDGNFQITSISGTTVQYQYSSTTQTQALLPSSGGTATVPLPTFCSYLPDFVTTIQTTAVYVANYGAEGGANCAFASTDSVALLSPVNGSVTNIAYLNNPPGTGPAPHPVALAETPDAQNLYVVNQGNDTVVDLSPTDLSMIATIPVGTTPIWAVARLDNRRVYVLTQGAGTLIPIDTASNTILPSQTNLSVGAGANFLLYDPTLSRLYVTNPTTGNVFVYSTTGGVDLSGNANDTPTLLATISMSAGTNPPCLGGCSPVSVTALPDGSRFYVASYQSQSTCADLNVGRSPCIVPMLTVFDAPSIKPKTPVSTLLKGSSSLSLLTSPPFSPTQYAVIPTASCATPTLYAPGTTRFRMFTTASADSSHVYVGICDAGAIADVTTVANSVSQGTNSPDTLVTDIVAPFGACAGPNCSSVAPITSFSITNNVVTIQAVNDFVPGEQVQISGLTTGTYLNGQTLTVLSATTGQFTAKFTHSDVGTTVDSGTALGIQVATITSFSITNNVVTFQAVNTFTPGTRVSISNLQSAPGAALNGQTLTVITTGLSAKQFECVLTIGQANVGSTTDTGTAVPQVPPQNPVFLLTGQ